MVSSFTLKEVVSNLFYLISSMKHKGRDSEDCTDPPFRGIKSDRKTKLFSFKKEGPNITVHCVYDSFYETIQALCEKAGTNIYVIH